MSSHSAVPGSGRHRSARRGRLASASAAIKVLCAVMALLSVSLFLITGYAWYNYNSLDKGLKRLHLTNLGGAAAPAKSTKHGVTGTTQNILITGIDSRSGLSPKEQKLLKVGSDSNAHSTDTIILVHIPAGGAKATMISIPRDSYVDIPGHPKNKINAAYIDGYMYTDGATTTKERENAGADSLIATVKKLTGQDVDHYIQVGFGGFYKIAQAINGIDVNLSHSVDDSLVRNRAQGSNAGSGFKMSAGPHHLDAVQSLEFVRQRHNLPGIGNDLGREKRQQYFITTAFHTIATAGILFNPSKLGSLISAIKGSFFVDDALSLPNLAEQMVNLNSKNIASSSIPTSGSATISGGVGSVITVDPAQVKAYVTRQIDGAPSGPASGANRATASAPSRSAAAPATPTSATPKASCIN
jgi:LCP family protein required for cell wall assembly